MDGLIHPDGTRSLSFGEFLADWRDPASAISGGMELVDLLRGFHPRTHPVLWRVLVATYLCYDLLRRLHHAERWDRGYARSLAESPTPGVLDWLDWHEDMPVEVQQAVDVGIAHVCEVVDRSRARVVQR